MPSDKLIEGFWYLPGRRSEKIPGVLELYDSGDIRLRLFGWPFPKEPTGRFYQAPDIILGDSISYGLITLVDAFVCRGPIKKMGDANDIEILGSEFGAVAVHFGGHILQRNKINSKCLRVMFSNNILWKFPPSFSKSGGKSRSLSIGRKTAFPINLQRPKVLYKGQKFSVVYKEEIACITDGNTSFYGVHPYLEIRTPRKRHFDDFRMMVSSLTSYLSFISRTGIQRTSVAYKLSEEYFFIRVKSRFAGIQSSNEIGKSVSQEACDCFFSLADVYGGYRSSLAVWLDNYETFFPIYELYLSSLNKDNTIDQTVFTLARACEALYRRTHQKKGNFQGLIKKMVEDSHPKIVQYIGDTMEFSEIIKDVRNYYAHYEPKQISYPFSGDELLDVQKKLRLVLEINILKWMKLSEAQIRNCVRQVWAYGHLM